MVSLSRTGRRFMNSYWLEDGREILGKIDEPSSRPAPNYEFVINRRVLVTPPEGEAKAGDIMIDGSGTRFILALNGIGELNGSASYKNFRLVEANQQLRLLQRGITIDPVTNVEREGVSVDAGDIWVAREPIRGMTDRVFRVEEDQFRIISSAPLNIKDKIGDHLVEKVSYLLGVYVTEVR